MSESSPERPASSMSDPQADTVDRAVANASGILRKELRKSDAYGPYVAYSDRISSEYRNLSGKLGRIAYPDDDDWQTDPRAIALEHGLVADYVYRKNLTRSSPGHMSYQDTTLSSLKSQSELETITNQAESVKTWIQKQTAFRPLIARTLKIDRIDPYPKHEDGIIKEVFREGLLFAGSNALSQLIAETTRSASLSTRTTMHAYSAMQAQRHKLPIIGEVYVPRGWAEQYRDPERRPDSDNE